MRCSKNCWLCLLDANRFKCCVSSVLVVRLDFVASNLPQEGGFVSSLSRRRRVRRRGLSRTRAITSVCHISYRWAPRKTSGLDKRAKIFPMKSKGNFSDSMKQGSFSRCPGCGERSEPPHFAVRWGSFCSPHPMIYWITAIVLFLLTKRTYQVIILRKLHPEK